MVGSEGPRRAARATEEGDTEKEDGDEEEEEGKVGQTR